MIDSCSASSILRKTLRINRTKALTYDEIKVRYKAFRKCMDFGDITPCCRRRCAPCLAEISEDEVVKCHLTTELTAL